MFFETRLEGVSTVLIASPERLAPLKDRSGYAEAQSFSDAEASRALEVITRERPAVVALDRLFAATSRGTALVNRIRADPALAACEIRIVEPESLGPESATLPVTAPVTLPVTLFGATPLDQRGTRRATRTRVPGRIEVLVDGNPATLIDVSPIGAQVVSPTILRPNQRVRITLQDPVRPIRVTAGVAWASLEMPKEGMRYRAGLEFFDADAGAISSWIARLG